jgi:hypothetical protein
MVQLIDKVMGNYLYALAVILVIAWIIGFFGTNAGSSIHFLLVIAIAAVFLKATQGGKIVSENKILQQIKDYLK